MALENISTFFSGSIPISDIENGISNKHIIRLEHFVGSTPSFLIQSLQKEKDHPGDLSGT